MSYTPTPINCKKYYEQEREIAKQYIYDNEIFDEYYLAVIQVGSENESTAYINGKKKDFEYIGALLKVVNINSKEPGFIKKLYDTIQEYNIDMHCAGIMVEIDRKLKRNYPDEVWQSIFHNINPNIDIDRAYYKNDIYIPATALGVLNLLENYLKVDLRKKVCCVIGRSQLVGKPIVDLLIKKGATVICCNSNTTSEQLKDITHMSDVIISAVGKPGILTAHHIYNNSVIIDIGTTYVDGKLKGDFDLDTYLEFKIPKVDIKYTSVPGGMGLVTRATLLNNFIIGVSWREKQRNQCNSSDIALNILNNSNFAFIPFQKKED